MERTSRRPAPWAALLEPLLRARRFDEILIEHAALLVGVYHVSIGMEATAAAVAAARRPGDAVMLGHRNHAHMVALGSDPEILYRELLARDGGPQRGRAGTLHLADPELGVPYTSAMLGGAAAIGAGLALARQRRGGDAVVIACFGDGAMGEGLIYETLNLAAAWRLPLVLVCENNGSAEAAGHLAAVAGAHGARTEVVDGRDPRATRDAVAAAVMGVRQDGGGPVFLEVGSEHWPGNATFLPTPQPPLDLRAVAGPPPDAFAAGDPVWREAATLVGEGIAIDALVELDAAVTAELAAAMDRAREAPPAPAAAALENVWGAP